MLKLRRPTPAMLALLVMSLLFALRFFRPPPTSELLNYRNVHVKVVYDGDTFETESGERVRFRGIDAPEVAHHDQKLEHFGNESTEWLKQLIDGKVVTLAIETAQQTDRYGRTLAWVYLSDGTLVNEASLRTGNSKLMDRFGLLPSLDRQLRQAAADAKENRRGLWAR